MGARVAGENNMIKVGITIQLRKEVLDTEGRTLLKLFQTKKLPVKECFYGKYIEIHLEETDKKKGLDLAHKIAKDILSNELIETFELKVVD